jgi:hypothetical protein
VQQNKKTSSAGRIHEAAKSTGKESTKQIRNNTQQAVKQRRKTKERSQEKDEISPVNRRDSRRRANQGSRGESWCQAWIKAKPAPQEIEQAEENCEGENRRPETMAIGRRNLTQAPTKRLKRKPVTKNRMQREQKNWQSCGFSAWTNLFRFKF